MKFLKNKSFVALGEAMVELSPLGSDDNLYRKGFGGDTYNTTKHVKARLGQQASVAYLTAVGNDKISDNFAEALRKDGIETRFIERVQSKIMGLYLIHLNEGERYFTYWRKNSAAKHLADGIEAKLNDLEDFGMVYLSGITLAILPLSKRSLLIEQVKHLQSAGCVVCFDPNSRLDLWESKDALRFSYEAVLPNVDIALPSFDDEAAIWQDANQWQTIERIARLGPTEILVKNGAGPLVASCAGSTEEFETKPVKNLIDTTGAGDAFNAGFLSARLSGSSFKDAVLSGQRLGRKAVQNRGACF